MRRRAQGEMTSYADVRTIVVVKCNDKLQHVMITVAHSTTIFSPEEFCRHPLLWEFTPSPVGALLNGRLLLGDGRESAPRRLAPPLSPDPTSVRPALKRGVPPTFLGDPIVPVPPTSTLFGYDTRDMIYVRKYYLHEQPGRLKRNDMYK